MKQVPDHSFTRQLSSKIENVPVKEQWNIYLFIPQLVTVRNGMESSDFCLPEHTKHFENIL
jgi:hypothetical protein